VSQGQLICTLWSTLRSRHVRLMMLQLKSKVASCHVARPASADSPEPEIVVVSAESEAELDYNGVVDSSGSVLGAHTTLPDKEARILGR
jgi:hypothetical protein